MWSFLTSVAKFNRFVHVASICNSTLLKEYSIVDIGHPALSMHQLMSSELFLL